MDLLSMLNDKQQKAVTCVNGPLLILAGAGSGKTRTIIHRIAYIIENGYAKPWEILALTFTNKAAGEMRERIDSMGIPFTSDIWMGTFHSICARILRMEGDNLGFTSNFSIYDDDDTKRLLKTILKELDISDKEFPVESVKAQISLLKNDLETSDDYMDEHGDFDEGYTEARIAQIYSEYQKRLLSANAMDFDDLLLNTNILFAKCPEVLNKYRNRFKYILVDEYQDTNISQYAIISKMAEGHRNICVCGDDDQSIYGWRGASIRNILEFEDDFEDAKIIRLEQNYRCTKNILNAANGVIEHNKKRMGKTLFTDNEEGEIIKYLHANSDLEESSIIAREIFCLNEYHDIPYSDIAILYRTNAQSRVLEEGLMRRNIPYQIVAGTKFYDRMEIKDILAYLKLLVNPKDDIAFIRVINTPKRGIGPASIEKIRDYAFMKGISMYEVIKDIDTCPLFKGSVKEKLTLFKDTMEELERIAKENSLMDTVINTIHLSGYEQMLKEGKVENAQNRLENLDELVNAAGDFENNEEDGSLEAFLENAALVAGVDSYDENSSKVLLMTLHNAKGLEFNIVFMPGMEENLFPTYRAVNEESEMEEERRLCYVGITRARKKLYMSSAETRRVYGRNEMRNPSRFLLEVPDELIEGISAIKESNKEKEIINNNVKKMYDPYANTIRQTQNLFKQNNTFDEKLSPGDKIDHNAWGEGTVVSIEGSEDDMKITAAFPEIGIKKFMASVAKFKKI
ncbi:DNA helicase PcrA [Anaerofustis sp. NSJ-163]|uniref:DNA helicase PcrA n=1 Tax=Anaerofustis sp. NSJ-163 TaxID=2944391 RepID=UPI00209BF520|nr:DNA helicase PcrA [Anaerofustis sp. NSJ-163]MCO8193657.1 DNA helicase PcrA [Anaerofustis sp. NSJ-163]